VGEGAKKKQKKFLSLKSYLCSCNFQEGGKRKTLEKRSRGRQRNLAGATWCADHGGKGGRGPFGSILEGTRGPTCFGVQRRGRT